jgi:branched-chain amino acid transport system permease protein
VLNLDPIESRILYGVCLIAVILLLPNGLIAGAIDGWQKLVHNPARKQPGTPAANAKHASEAGR